VAALRKRRNLDDLQTKTAADGVITGELGAMGLKRIGSGKGSKSTESTLR